MNIFFIWQSSLKQEYGLLSSALKAAANSIAKDKSIDVEPAVDRDTKGLPGSPEITQAILKKIRAADAVVADVTIIPSTGAPNPNVLFESGVAFGAIGQERVVLVMNTSHGGPELLPFDLSHQRILKYRYPTEGSKGQDERHLTAAIETAIRAIIADAEGLKTPAPLLPLKIAIEESIENVQAWLERVDRIGIDQFISYSVNRYPKLASPLLEQAIRDAANQSSELYKELSAAGKSLAGIDAAVDALWQSSMNPHPHFLQARNRAIEAEAKLTRASAILQNLKTGA